MNTSQIIGLIVVMIISAIIGYFICKRSKAHSLVKWVSLFILMSMAITWILTSGYFNNTEFVDYGMNHQGLTDILNLLYYSINFAGDKIIYLLALGAFYAVLSRCDSYKKIVTNIAAKFKGKEIYFALVSSLIITLLTTILSQTFVVLLFVPFLISILLNMKLDKITAFAITFGSILIGNLGLLYGGEGAYWFNYYTQTTIKTAMLYRVIILVVAYVLFSVFNVLHMKKILNDKKLNEIESDPFMVEKTTKSVKVWPTVVLLVMLFILVILGFVNWEGNFGITAFNSFHEWLMNLTIGKFAIFKALLGTLASDASKGAFGVWNLFHISTLLVFFSILFAIIGKINLNEFIDAYIDGFKKVLKPIGFLVAAYMVMVAAYMSPYMPTITNALFKKVATFNPYLVSLDALLANIFHVDFGFTGYTVGAFIAAKYASSVNVIHTIFTTMYGFVGLFAPTSIIMLLGLSYLKIDYKTWIKYIWIFILAMLVILLVLYTLMTYI